MAIRMGGRLLTQSEQKRAVMQWAGWTEKEYKRRYNVFYLRVRNYERAAGYQRGELNAPDMFARDVRAQSFARKTGQPYEPTNLIKSIQAAPATGLARDLSERAKNRTRDAALHGIYDQYSGILNRSKYSDEVKSDIAELLRRPGGATPQEIEKTIRGYIDMLDREKRTIAEMNENVTNPLARLIFRSS